MAQTVRFFFGTREQYNHIVSPNPLALYFCEDTGELFRGSQCISDGIRIVSTRNDLPELSVAADGIVYFVHDSGNGYMVSPDRTEWLQTIYAPVHDAYVVPESEIYNTVTTVGAVRDVEKKIYDRIAEVVADITDIPTSHVEKSNINGNIKVDGVETVVYKHPTKHNITDIEGLQDALDGKQGSGDFADENHKHTKDQIIDFEHTHASYDITDLDATIKTYDYATKTELNGVNAKFADYVTSETYDADKADINKAIDDEAARADAAEKALAGRLDTLEAIDHDAYVAADSAMKTELQAEIATAKTEAANQDVAVLAEAQVYANQAQSAAEDKAAELDTALKAEIDADVKVVSDAVALKANVADVYSKSETYSKEEVDAAVAASGGGVSSWNDLTDKPFGEEGGGLGAITWDGVGDYVLEDESGPAASFIKVSDVVFNVSDLVGAAMAFSDDEQIDYTGSLAFSENDVMSFFEYMGEDPGEAVPNHGAVAFMNGTSTDSTGTTSATKIPVVFSIPEFNTEQAEWGMAAGTYFIRFAPTSEGKIIYLQSITFPGGTIKTLDEKFIPDTIARKADVVVEWGKF